MCRTSSDTDSAACRSSRGYMMSHDDGTSAMRSCLRPHRFVSRAAAERSNALTPRTGRRGCRRWARSRGSSRAHHARRSSASRKRSSTVLPRHTCRSSIGSARSSIVRNEQPSTTGSLSCERVRPADHEPPPLPCATAGLEVQHLQQRARGEQSRGHGCGYRHVTQYKLCKCACAVS